MWAEKTYTKAYETPTKQMPRTRWSHVVISIQEDITINWRFHKKEDFCIHSTHNMLVLYIFEYTEKAMFKWLEGEREV